MQNFTLKGIHLYIFSFSHQFYTKISCKDLFKVWRLGVETLLLSLFRYFHFIIAPIFKFAHFSLIQQSREIVIHFISSFNFTICFIYNIFVNLNEKYLNFCYMVTLTNVIYKISSLFGYAWNRYLA